MNKDELRNLESVITDCLDVLHTCMNRFKYVETQVRKLLQEPETQKTEFTFTAHGIANEPQKQAKQYKHVVYGPKIESESVIGLVKEMKLEDKERIKQLLEAVENRGKASNP